jgi:hypothetical protein
MHSHPPPQAQADPGDEHDDDYQQLEAWLFDRFIALGFGAGEAAALVKSHAPWHEAERLLAHGCSKDLALSILL